MKHAPGEPENLAVAEASLAAAQAALAEAGSALAETELQAPFAGVVAAIEPVAGELVPSGVVLVGLADTSSWQVETDNLTELDVVKLQTGAAAGLTFDALPGLQVPGKIVQIKPIGTKKQGDMTYTVVVRPDKLDDRLRWKHDRHGNLRIAGRCRANPKTRVNSSTGEG